MKMSWFSFLKMSLYIVRDIENETFTFKDACYKNNKLFWG